MYYVHDKFSIASIHSRSTNYYLPTEYFLFIHDRGKIRLHMAVKHKIGIIGFGRFGKVLHRLLQSEFDIYVFDPTDSAFDNTTLNRVDSVKELFENCSTIF